MEMEVKLLLDPRSRSLVEEHPAFQTGKPKERREITTYYDTPDLALMKLGASLRVRQSGTDIIQTVKLDQPEAGVGIRGEWEWVLDAPTPSLPDLASLPPEAARVREAAAQAEPVFVTEITRTSWALQLPGDASVEVVIDQGTIRAGAQSTEVSEVEIELKGGPSPPLFVLAADLADRAALRFGPQSKAERGYELVTGAPRINAGPIVPRWPKGTTIATAFPRLVQAALRDLAAEMPGAARGDVEGVHRMRAAIRRLRSVLVLFDPYLDRRAARRFNAALRELGAVLGRGRDWDVFVTLTLSALESTAHGADAALLRGPAERCRAQAHAAVTEALSAQMLTGLILGIALWTSGPDWLKNSTPEAELADLVPELLDTLEAKVRKRARNIDQDDAEELHGLRKSLKKLRYSAEYFGSLFGKKPVAHYLRVIKALLNRLGEINDAAVTEQRVDEVATPERPDLAPAAAALLAWNAERRARATRHFGKKLDRLKQLDPFWR